MNKKPYLSVVIPAYNEAMNLKNGVLDELFEYMHKQTYDWEILFTDDGSTDETVKLAKTYAKGNSNVRILEEPHRGKAGTVIAGMLAATGQYVLFTDTDQATPIHEIEKLLPKLEGEFDIAIGSRSGRKGAPLIRKIMAFGFAVLRTLILRLPYKDTQCGFKAFKYEASQKIFTKMKQLRGNEKLKGYTVTAGFDLELLYLARKFKLKVAEVPVEWEDSGKGQVNPIKDSWIGLKGMLQVRMNALQGKYKV